MYPPQSFVQQTLHDTWNEYLGPRVVIAWNKIGLQLGLYVLQTCITRFARPTER